MANKISTATRKTIIRCLVEGNSIRGTSRLTGAHKNTVGKVIMAFGTGCQRFMDEQFRGLDLRHVEVDEMWSYVLKKQARLTVEEKQTRHDIGDQYLWFGVDQDTKLVPCHLVGKRSADNARRFMVDLAKRMVLPNPHASDDHAYQKGEYRTLIQLSTDGFNAYPEAVDLAFGQYCKHGVIIKQYRNASMQYDPSEMIGTDRRAGKNLNTEDDLWTICTSHVERFNGTVRTFMKRCARLTLAFSKKLECLEAAVAMYLAHYNFVWRSRFSDQSGKRGTLKTPAAMQAGIVSRLWSFDDLYEAVRFYE